jgi:hypothetical protein
MDEQHTRHHPLRWLVLTCLVLGTTLMLVTTSTAPLLMFLAVTAGLVVISRISSWGGPSD